ncbi:fuculose phosphate aldolase [Burkholderia ubonensis]|uniref:class II aldolase/adducin family protein n=1 Tax=Burkholderia ubonensis TaxID=101571 RepID=UPI0007556B2B|nr:class II aldolase/adducin family protein [Burkholderia ubonensis]KWA74744.1 fuculose phosphate aldolase [Burkholderia ubonensis]KWB30345.1 fuculose phosphate aldolase [Burkholderia ubonensis]KWO44516.1 fuculose phosphate aldolase [Burkholderia ubonensis]
MKTDSLAQRQRVVDLCQELSRRGYFSATGGNLALRIDPQHIAVTPSAIPYHMMTVDNVSVLRLRDLSQIEGDCVPSVETSLHARVLRARSDVVCTIHTHQPIASACALDGRSIPVRDEAMRAMLGPHVPVVGYAPSGTGWLAAKFARKVRPEINAYLMFNHGALCCGGSVEQAVSNVDQLEILAHRHLSAQIKMRAASNPLLRPALSRVLATLQA